MASLEPSQPFDPRSFFDGQPCPRCQARNLDKSGFRDIPCRDGEKVFILKCHCNKEMVLGLIYGPNTDGDYYKRPGIFLVNHSKFHCPVCKEKPKAANWFSSGGSTKGYEMLTLNCHYCVQNSSIMVKIEDLDKGPVPPVVKPLDREPLASAEAGPVTTDYLLEFHGLWSEDDLLRALQGLPSIDWETKVLPPQTETRPKKT